MPFTSHPAPDSTGLNGVNRQPSNGQKFNGYPSKTLVFNHQPSKAPRIWYEKLKPINANARRGVSPRVSDLLIEQG